MTRPARLQTIDLGFLGKTLYWVECPRAAFVPIVKQEFAACDTATSEPSDKHDGEFHRIHDASGQIIAVVIWFAPRVNISTVAHECMHATGWVLGHLFHHGLSSYEAYRDEFYPHLVGYLVGEIAAALNIQRAHRTTRRTNERGQEMRVAAAS